VICADCADHHRHAVAAACGSRCETASVIRRRDLRVEILSPNEVVMSQLSSSAPATPTSRTDSPSSQFTTDHRNGGAEAPHTISSIFHAEFSSASALAATTRTVRFPIGDQSLARLLWTGRLPVKFAAKLFGGFYLRIKCNNQSPARHRQCLRNLRMRTQIRTGPCSDRRFRQVLGLL